MRRVRYKFRYIVAKRNYMFTMLSTQHEQQQQLYMILVRERFVSAATMCVGAYAINHALICCLQMLLGNN